MKSCLKKLTLKRIGFVASLLAGSFLGTPGTAVATAGWINMATEGQIFTPPANFTFVRYGQYHIDGCEACMGQWTFKHMPPGEWVACDNATFGEPYAGKVKRCDIFAVLQSVANEHQSLPGIGTYVYGQFSPQGVPDPGGLIPWYLQGIFGGPHYTSGSCDNNNFGDVYPGIVKACFLCTNCY